MYIRIKRNTLRIRVWFSVIDPGVFVGRRLEDLLGSKYPDTEDPC